MKKVLLFVVLATSMNASAQDLPSTPGMHHPTPWQLTTVQLNDSIYTWRWDWNIPGWTVESKIINIEYDASNNLIFFTSQERVGTAWVNDYQHTYTYDANHNLTSRLVQWWEYSGWWWDPGAWVNVSQCTYTYDTNSNLTSEYCMDNNFGHQITFTYDLNNNKTSELYESPWGGYQNTYSYDSKNNLTSEVHQGLNGYSTNDYKNTYAYDTKNNKILERHQVWNGTDWVTDFHYRYFYTYDARNNKTSEIVQLAEGNTLFYVNTNKFSYTYDDSSNLTSEIKQMWENDYWVNFYKYTFTYDINNNEISKFTGGWLGNAWVYYLQDIYTFDANNNPTSHVSQELNGTTWKIVDQWLYTYEDGNFKISESHRHFDINDPGTVITDGDSTHYYFHTVTTAINNVKEDDGDFNVYPNPSSGKFTISSKIDISAIEIYNMLGERVYSNSKLNQQPSKDIDLSGQGKGIYIVNMYEGKIMYTRKVVVQ